jgi:hypothetical protein
MNTFHHRGTENTEFQIEATDTKHQIPNHNQFPNSKSETSGFGELKIGHCNFIWNLVFGVWAFS